MGTSKKDSKLYVIFRKSGPPLSLASTEDLIKIWFDGSKERIKDGNWALPIVFKDEGGEGFIAMIADEIKAIVRGKEEVPQPEPQQPGSQMPPHGARR